jgi:PilZ domain
MTMPLNLTEPDRRKFPRRAVSQVVKLELSDGPQGDQPALLVMDISSGGARLFVQGVDVPETFALVFTETGIRRECRRVWAIGAEIGVEFVERVRRMPAKRASGTGRPRA